MCQKTKPLYNVGKYLELSRAERLRPEQTTKISRVCREGLFLLPYNELAVALGPKIYQKNEL